MKTANKVSTWQGVACALLVGMSTASMPAQGEGNEQLGAVMDPAITSALESGSKIRISGTGLHSLPDTPGTITIDVNPGESIERVLLYWQVFDSDVGYDTEIDVAHQPSGSIYQVDGEVVGEFVSYYGSTLPETAFYASYSATIRADITELGILQSGSNTLEISGLDDIELSIPGFGDDGKNGAGVMLIYSDGTESELQLFDGHDAIWWKLDRATFEGRPIRFEFDASDTERIADLSMFVASVEGMQSGEERASVVEIRIGDDEVIRDVNVLTSAQGDEWDDYMRSITIPAGATFVEVEIFSETDPFVEPDPANGVNPASLVWVSAGLAVYPLDEEICNCRPKSLTFKYVGGTCDATTNDLDGMLKCHGDLNGANGIDISVFNKRGKSKRYDLDDNWVATGETFTISGKKRKHRKGNGNLPRKTKLVLENGGDKLVLKLDTSCDKLLQVGDQFGPLVLVDFDAPEECDNYVNQCRKKHSKHHYAKWWKKWGKKWGYHRDGDDD